MATNIFFMPLSLLFMVPLLVAGSDATLIMIDAEQKRQEFRGMGCGSIFYSGHITSFAKKKPALQEKYYDDLFTSIKTQYLQIMIRPDFEAINDNEDPYILNFPEGNFKANASSLAICKAAKIRRPDMKIYAVLYTPPAWMKTNGEIGGGGKQYATLKEGLSLELCEYLWAYLTHMQANGMPVDYLSFCNEADWEHKQPSYFLSGEAHAQLLKDLVGYLQTMSVKHPEIPVPKLVGPNMLSAVGTARKYWPAMKRLGVAKHLDVVASHDYHRAPRRWKALRKLVGPDRDLWCSEWSYHKKDASTDLIVGATEFWSMMIECFNDGANTWMAYDWAYPPREGGEALTHVEWGKFYHKTRIYHGFKQWCNALEPGMRVVQSYTIGTRSPEVHACGFLSSDSKRLVVHVVNMHDREAAMTLKLANFSPVGAEIHRTSLTKTGAVEAAKVVKKELSAELGPRQMVTIFLRTEVSP